MILKQTGKYGLFFLVLFTPQADQEQNYTGNG
jgi:hypothetical protein